jgi:hypothetical protein
MEDEEYKESEISKKVKELMDDGYEFGEAVREALKEGFADGGSIGIEVLFKPKRQELFMGGPALTGPALGIYNSMKAYQSFTDQEIADAIKQAGYDLPTSSTPPDSTPPSSTPSNNQSGDNEGQGGIMNLDPYSKGPASPRNQTNNNSPLPQQLLSLDEKKGNPAFMSTVPNPGDYSYSGPIQQFSQIGENLYDVNPLGTITGQRTYKEPRTIGDQVYAAAAKGQLGTEVEEEKGFIGSAIDKFSNLSGIKQGKNLINNIMDNTLVGRIAAMRNPLNPNASNYNPSLQGQIDMLGGMTGSRITGTSGNLKTTEGLAMLGRDPNSGLGVYGPGSVLAGQNVVSAFGTNDYEDQLQGYIDKMLDRRTKGILTEFQEKKLEAAEAELERAREKAQERIDELNKQKAKAKAEGDAKKARDLQIAAAAKAQEISNAAATAQQEAIERDQARDRDKGGGANQSGGGYSSGSGYNEGNYCFDPSTLIQMADGSTKEIKNIQLGDNTKGGEVTGVFQFKASDEIHDYKGVTVAGSHYVKEDGKFIMVKDSPLAVKIDKIPVVYSLDTTGRRIFINDIEFADYNGDGVAKNFLTNAGVDLTGFDTEVLRQVEHRLI